VQFYNGTTPLGTPKTLTGGKATLTMPDLLVKSNTIRATYGGAAGYLTSTTTLSQVVNKSATKTTLVASPNPSIKGQTVTFTATVSAVAPGGGLPTGTVQFYDGNKLLGTQQPLVSGTATFKYAGLPRGNHTITVIYGGTPNYKNSTSNSIVQIVK
jgi:hypothetical protein